MAALSQHSELQEEDGAMILAKLHGISPRAGSSSRKTIPHARVSTNAQISLKQTGYQMVVHTSANIPAGEPYPLDTKGAGYFDQLQKAGVINEPIYINSNSTQEMRKSRFPS